MCKKTCKKPSTATHATDLKRVSTDIGHLDYGGTGCEVRTKPKKKQRATKYHTFKDAAPCANKSDLAKQVEADQKNAIKKTGALNTYGDRGEGKAT